MPARAQLDLRRPAQVRAARCATSTATVANGPTSCVSGDRPLRAHAVERDGAGRDRRRVAVLQPQDHPLVLARRRQAGVAIRRPGIGVVRAGQAGAVVAGIGVERVFHHVVAGRADRVHEQLAGERRQAEALAHRAAVDGEAAGPGRNLLLPGRQHRAVRVEQPQPQPDRAAAVAGPVVRRHQPRGQPIGIAEEHEVGREVQLVEIARTVGQQRVRQLRLVQRDDLRARRQQMRDARRDPPGVECGDQHGARAAVRQFGQRARHIAGALLAHRGRRRARRARRTAAHPDTARTARAAMPSGSYSATGPASRA